MTTRIYETVLLTRAAHDRHFGNPDTTPEHWDGEHHHDCPACDAEEHSEMRQFIPVAGAPRVLAVLIDEKGLKFPTQAAVTPTMPNRSHPMPTTTPPRDPHTGRHHFAQHAIDEGWDRDYLVTLLGEQHDALTKAREALRQLRGVNRVIADDLRRQMPGKTADAMLEADAQATSALAEIIPLVGE